MFSDIDQSYYFLLQLINGITIVMSNLNKVYLSENN